MQIPIRNDGRLLLFDELMYNGIMLGPLKYMLAKDNAEMPSIRMIKLAGNVLEQYLEIMKNLYDLLPNLWHVHAEAEGMRKRTVIPWWHEDKYFHVHPQEFFEVKSEMDLPEGALATYTEWRSPSFMRNYGHPKTLSTIQITGIEQFMRRLDAIIRDPPTNRANAVWTTCSFPEVMMMMGQLIALIEDTIQQKKTLSID